jgi:eukaryotic-like serine/threonine-protein kinase
MGDVYRAKDPRLGRDVAVKVLGTHLAADSTALIRFEREAQALAALSHPGIVAVYDVGRHGSSAYVVMEFLEGETLRVRLAAGPIGLRKTLDYAIQIAQALAAAHDRGIVHRDLKPENVFLCTDGRLKVLDFGIVQLASASAAISAETVIVAAPRATAPDTVIGTVGYMAPEQARGQQVDARADIFSLGAVIYEMLSGQRAFDGDTGVDVLTCVLHRDPPELAPELRVPTALDRIVRRCLEKRPDERFQSARDLAFALEGVASGSGTMPVSEAPRERRRVPWWALPLAAILALGAGLLLGRLLQPRAPAPERAAAVRFTFEAYRGGQLPEVSVSPTGRYIAWTEMTNGGTGGVWVRRLDDTQPSLAIDVMPSVSPFWSIDGTQLVVLGPANQLLAIDAASGERRVVTELPSTALPYRGGDWSARGLVLAVAEGIVLTDPAGRGSQPLTRVEAPREAWHGWPSMLPDGTRFVYTVGLASGQTETRIGSLDGGTNVRVALAGTTSRVRVDQRGYLVFAQNRSLFAQPFNAESGDLQGTAVRVAPEVFQNPITGWAAADISRNGIVAWRAPGVDEVQFEWVDRGGRTVRSVGDPDAYTNFDLSPDGTRIVATRRRDASGSALYLIDSERNLSTPISKEDTAAPVSDPTWSPDGQLIAYRRGGSLVIRNVFGGEERVLTSGATYPDSWSRDGKWLTVGRPQENDYRLSALSLDHPGEPVTLVEGVRLADEPRFSPDGKWIAFHGAVQTRPEVFAIRFPPTGERWQLSTGGGVQPRWRADGKELFYLGPDGDVMSVTVPGGDPTKAGRPLRLFSLRMEPSAAFDQFTPTADGELFLVRRPMRPGGADSAPVHVIVNWPSTLPAPR